MNYETVQNISTIQGISNKQKYLDQFIAHYRQQISEWDEIIECLANEYDAPSYSLEYAFAYWFTELIDEIKDEPFWFIHKINRSKFEDCLEEFTPEPDDHEDWYGNDF